MDTPTDNPGQVPAKISGSKQLSHCPRSVASHPAMVLMTKQEAAGLVKRMLGSYPSLNLHDPQTYIATVTALLTGYSLVVGEKAVEKITETIKFPPAPAEVKAALEEFRPRASYGDDWNAHSQKQLAERAEIAALPPPKQTWEEVQAEMRARGLPMGGPAPHKETAATVMAKHNLTQDQWDAIPDAPPSDHWQQLLSKHRHPAPSAASEGGG